MLDRHPHIACGPELRVIPALASFAAQMRVSCGEVLQENYGVTDKQLSAIFHDLISSFFEPYRKIRGKKRIAEKTPANILHFGELKALFPDASFVHVIRDGRDVVASLMTMDWTDAATGQPMAITCDPAIAAAAWAHHVRTGMNAKAAGQRIFELRYEELIADPKRVLSDLFAFLGEPWSEDALSYHLGDQLDAGMAESSAEQVSRSLYHQSINRWRHDLSAPAKQAIKHQAGDLLTKLGYAADNDW